MARRLASGTQVRRAAILTGAVAIASGIAFYSGASGAGAAPAPSISQVRAEVNSLQARVDKIGQQYDGATQQLSAAKARLAQVSREATRAQQGYNTARAQLIAVAVAAYENADRTSIAGLLSSGDPSVVLSQASLVLEVAGTHNLQAQQLLASARELATIRAERQHTEEGVAQLHAQIAAKKSKLTKLLDSRKALLSNLTAQQQALIAQNSVNGGGTSTTPAPVTYTGPTTTQADKAVAFAYAQIGKPYVWGATGPNSYDCSGLVQAAWASAGVSIPRTTYEQWAALPHIPMSELQPGDLLYYNGEGHVAMYVGNGYIIDAPHTGAYVERIPESYMGGTLDGAARP